MQRFVPFGGLYGLCFAALAAAVNPASADGAAALDAEPVAESAVLLKDCFDAAEPGDSAARRACLGVVTARCLDRAPGAGAQYADRCILLEADAWETLMGREFDRLVAQAERGDAFYAGRGAEWQKEASALRGAQAAWAAYRTAQCGYAYHRWHDGSMRRTDAAICQRDMVAARTLFLWLAREGLAAAEGPAWQ